MNKEKELTERMQSMNSPLFLLSHLCLQEFEFFPLHILLRTEELINHQITKPNHLAFGTEIKMRNYVGATGYKLAFVDVLD